MGWWKKLKRAVKTVVRQAATVCWAAVHNIIPNGLDLLLGFLKWPQKKMRIRINILTEPNNGKPRPIISINTTTDPVTGLPVITYSNPNLIKAIDFAKKVFKEEFNVKIVSNGIYIVPDIPPDVALNPSCSGLYGQDFGEAGEFYASHGYYGSFIWGVFQFNPIYPIDVFVVSSVGGKIGCSLGPLTNWVVISPPGIDNESTLAHELAHACNLWHRPNVSSLMYHDKIRGRTTKLWQANFFRSCRHVNYY